MEEKTAKRVKGKKRSVVGFQVLEKECIWMKAGVINFRMCDNSYDCYNCPFDMGMSKAMGMASPAMDKEQQPGWVEHLKRDFHGSSRPCRHVLTGHVSAPKICTKNYECYHCAYDQMLDELDFQVFTDTPNYKLASGYRMAQGYYYHMGHSWARFEHGGRVRVGFDDFIVKLFGAAKSLELPPLGCGLKQNQVGWTFGKDDHEAAVLAPVTGTVIAVNHRAKEDPEITHHDPYQQGWLFMMEPEFPKKNLKGLYFEDESFKWIEKEGQKLMGLMGPEYEQLASTGGEPIGDFFGAFPDVGWDKLTTTFLGTEKL